ncbi:MAG: LysR family transcriptional regulator [Gammaproteobacteria bacterium]|nr:LysR family transcriptional regulator [Gammaproteobacteria bacterium]TVQ44584.1 MAG: LysR family transcriptional regulator [Gammaproteobacteria bacterium]
MLDRQRLTHFLAVMAHRHFGRAADAVRVTQPAMTKSIRKLETELGCQLFERGRFGAVPTDAALVLERRAQLILAESRLAEAELASLHGGRGGRISVGVGISLATRIMPQALMEYRRRWPQVTVKCDVGNSAELYPRLVGGELDLVISAPLPSVPVDPGLQQTLLYVEEDALVVRVGHPLHSEPPQSLEDLLAHPWVISPEMGMWSKVLKVFSDAGVQPPRDRVETTSSTLAKALMLQGDYMCVLSRDLYHAEAQQGLLAALDFAPFRSRRDVYLAFRRNSPLQTAASNMAWVIERLCR